MKTCRSPFLVDAVIGLKLHIRYTGPFDPVAPRTVASNGKIVRFEDLSRSRPGLAGRAGLVSLAIFIPDRPPSARSPDQADRPPA